MSVDRDALSEFESAFDNRACREIINHLFSESVLLFEILVVDTTKLHLPYLVLKQDHLHDCAKHITSYVT